MAVNPLKLVSDVVLLAARIGVGVLRAVAEGLLGEPERPPYAGDAEPSKRPGPTPGVTRGASEASRPARPGPSRRPAPGPARRRPRPTGGGVRGRPRAEPGHVSEEPRVVAEVAGGPAEGTPGPEIRVEEPWRGYDGMKAAEVRQRLEEAGTEVAAAVRLYEGTRKKRATVIRAAEEQLGR